MKIAYLINQYPKVSHSFIRREIMELETLGISIARFAIRSPGDELVDEADIKELEKTKIILKAGILNLLISFLITALKKPIFWLKTLKLVFQIGIFSERGILIHFAYFAEACILRQWLLKLEITHLHAHFGTNSTTVAMLCNLLGGPPYSFTVHGPEEFDKVQLIALEEKIKRSAFVIAISDFCASQLYRWCHYNQWSKIHIIHCAIEQKFLNHSPTPIVEKPHFVCVGRLVQNKGYFILLQAIYQLVKEGIPCKLVLVGDGLLRKEIETKISQLNLNNHITITGWASSTKVIKEMLAARAVILTSFAEGLPVVLMEALALHRPVISTYIAGIPELVKPDINGWLIPAGSVEALTNILHIVSKLPTAKLEEMGKNGAKTVIEQHNIRIEAQKLMDLFYSYHSLIDL